MSMLGVGSMSNYEFCAQWVAERADSRQISVLDYGCGSGEIVKLLRQQEIEGFGCDVFYDGADYSDLVKNPLFGTSILKMDGGKIPFADNFFDFIISNQVIEHVEDIDLVLSEFQRVLKPGGQILNLFPDKDIWREGHCNIPFLHWFPKRSRLRVYYAFGLRSIGMGSFKGKKTPMQWSRDICEWLDQWTYYRTGREIDREYARYFSEIQSIEITWLQRRLGRHKWLVTWLPNIVQKLIVRKLAGRAIVARNL
jgi:SAM-dependent methyltransferase